MAAWLVQQPLPTLLLMGDHKIDVSQPVMERPPAPFSGVPEFSRRGNNSPRVLQQVVEAGLGHLPFLERSVVTPTGHPYIGVDFCKKICGVSIIRSGESMENALRACCKGVKIGKILVHR